MADELNYEVRWEDWDGSGTVTIWQDPDNEWAEPARISLPAREAVDRLNELVTKIQRECEEYAWRR